MTSSKIKITIPEATKYIGTPQWNDYVKAVDEFLISKFEMLDPNDGTSAMFDHVDFLDNGPDYDIDDEFNDELRQLFTDTLFYKVSDLENASETEKALYFIADVHAAEVGVEELSEIDKSADTTLLRKYKRIRKLAENRR